MRDIKFRAWDKEQKKMQTVSVLGINFGQGFLIRPEENGDNPDGFNVGTEDQRFILIQYTELKDKNDKEIYEGDLFKETYPAGYSIFEVCFGGCDNEDSYEDNISGNGWYLKEHRHWPEYELDIVDFTTLKELKEFEVIGNIYENKDLLTYE